MYNNHGRKAHGSGGPLFQAERVPRLSEDDIRTLAELLEEPEYKSWTTDLLGRFVDKSFLARKIRIDMAQDLEMEINNADALKVATHYLNGVSLSNSAAATA